MGVREDRLWAEYNAMKKFRSTVVTWQTMGANNPPDVYHFDYHLKSLVSFDKNGEPQFHTGFKLEVRFSLDYPRGRPTIRLISQPISLHPNIWRDGRPCIEGTQHWIPGIGVPLDWICQMVGEIIAFQQMNLSSPANMDSNLMKWTGDHLNFSGSTRVSNPIDPSPIRLPDLEDAIVWGK